MKPISVKFKCFGPYLEEQFIDFKKLQKGGIFLISGDTGSGKTTILDAMCCALYGESSGGTRGKFEEMRCMQATNGQETLVEFIFDSNGHRYKFIRTLKMARKNLNDYHNCLELIDGVYVPRLENPKDRAVTKLAEEIIGLNAQQFRQVIVLPQGKFETLLTSNSEEKEKILTQIFGAEKWDKIAQWISADTREKDSALKQEKAKIDAKLNDYSCQSLTELEALKELNQSQIKELLKTVELKQNELEVLKKDLENKTEENRLFEELDKRQKAFEDAADTMKSFADEEKLLALADNAERLRSEYEKFKLAFNSLYNAKTSLKNAQNNLEKSQADFNTANENKVRHEKQKKDIDKLREHITLLISKREIYSTLLNKKDLLKEKETALATAENELIKAEKVLADSEGRLVAAKSAKDIAVNECNNAENRYFKSIGGNLAEKLVTGAPCPVCGSTEHPSPAKKADEYISESDFTSFRDKLQKANKNFDDTFKAMNDARNKRDKAKTAHDSALNEKIISQNSYLAAQKETVDGIADKNQLELAISTAQTGVEIYDNEGTALLNNLNTATANLKAAEALLDNAQKLVEETDKAYQAISKVWKKLLDNSVFEDEAELDSYLLDFEERERRKAALSNAKSVLAHAKKELDERRESVKGKNRPDIEKQKIINTQAENALTKLKNDIAIKTEKQSNLNSDLKNLKARLEKYQIERQNADADMEFARRITGSSGIGLKRYVLGVMLTKITIQANQILQNIYGGRYRLLRTDEKTGSKQKCGLELAVRDINNEQRNVSTLSGGEKFLVALSLAIGLSAVVQAEGTGVKLEAMFVDEGFGSLSENALNDALDVLNTIHQVGGIVGIISHVDKLVETIPNRIEIIKTNNGSKCKMVCN